MRKRLFSASCALGLLLAMNASIARAADIYDSTNAFAQNLLFSAAAPNGSWGDDVTVDQTIPAGDRVIRQVSFGFVVPANITVPDCDAIVTFYTNEDDAAAGDTPALTVPLGAFRVHTGPFDPNAAARGFYYDSIDITGVIPGGVAMPNAGGVSVAFVLTGTTTLLTQPNISCACATAPDGQGGATINPGSNHLAHFYRDGRQNGAGFDPTRFNAIYTGAERYGFGAPFTNNNSLWLRLGNTTFPVPPNDLCANAVDVPVNTQVDGTSQGSTPDNQPSCIADPPAQTSGGVWYTVTGTGETILVDLCSATYDSILSVYCGSCSSLTCVAGDDDGCGTGGGGSTVQFCSISGTVYHILVHGFGGATGTFTLVVQSGGGACTPTVQCQANPCAGIIRGDSNNDGVVNNFDIDAFVQALTGGNCNTTPACICRNDTNHDGQVNNFDIDTFVACVIAGACPP